MPPSCNTGVENTLGLKVLLDWVQFTVFCDDVESVFSVLAMDKGDFVRLDRGLYGYSEQYRQGNIVVLSKGAPGMGVHVVMSGRGCREYENMQGDNWIELIRAVLRSGGHFTRLDVAIDDRQGYYDLEMVREKVRSGLVRAVFKKSKDIVERGLRDSAVLGETIYFGSRSSSVMVRMYDKAKEKGEDCFWIRTEIEVKKERAQVLASEIVGGRSLGTVIMGVLKRYLNFVEVSSDSNKSRWSVSAWWLNYLGKVGEVRLTVAKVIKTVNDVADWIGRQIAPSLAMVNEKFGLGFKSFLDSVILDGRERWKSRHYAMMSGGAVS
jgi:phage replication initiation protein